MTALALLLVRAADMAMEAVEMAMAAAEMAKAEMGLVDGGGGFGRWQIHRCRASFELLRKKNIMLRRRRDVDVFCDTRAA